MAVPLFSVIITTFNRRKLLEKAIESVLSQTYKNFELIIVNDCSTDDTLSYLNSLDNDRISIFTNEKNMHVSYSRNRAIEQANGEWIVFVDDDDIMLENKLQVLADTIHASPQITFIHHRVWIDYVRDNKKRLSSNWLSENYKEEIYVSNMIGGPNNVCIKKTLLMETERFDTSLQLAEDYELWIRLIRLDKFKVKFLDMPLAVIHMERGKVSLDKDLEAFKKSNVIISQHYRKEIDKLSKKLKKKKQENYAYRYAARCIHGNKRLCATVGFWKAFWYSGKPKYFFAGILSLISPKLLIRLYR